MNYTPVDYSCVKQWKFSGGELLTDLVCVKICDWFKKHASRGAISRERGEKNGELHLQAVIEWNEKSKNYKPSHVNTMLNSVLGETRKWSHGFSVVNYPKQTYELLAFGYIRKDVDRSHFWLTEWGHEGMDVQTAVNDHAVLIRMKNTRVFGKVHTQNWFEQAVAFAKEHNMTPGSVESYFLWEVLAKMVNSKRYDMKAICGRLNDGHARMFYQMFSDKPCLSTDARRMFEKA